MDDLVQYVLEQIAVDGTRGASLSQLWTAVEEFYKSRDLVQNIDRQFQLYVWSVLIGCDEFSVCDRVESENGVEVHAIPTPIDDLAGLEATHGSNLVVRTSEERQWLTLTGHTVDKKKARYFLHFYTASCSYSRFHS